MANMIRDGIDAGAKIARRGVWRSRRSSARFPSASGTLRVNPKHVTPAGFQP